MTTTHADAWKAVALLFVGAILQVSIVAPLEVARGHPDLVLVLVVAIALLRGPVVGAVGGFWAGLVVDVAALQMLGLSSLLLTVAGYSAGRFGEITSRSSPHPPIVAVALVTVGVVLGSAMLHFMLGLGASAGEVLLQVLLPTLALNLLLAYPVYRLCRRVFGVRARERREVSLAV